MEKYIKEERLRLGMTQKMLGELLGVSNSFVSQIENGLSALPMDKLPVLAMHGFDVQYLITGVRSTNLNAVQQGTAPPRDASYDARMRRLSETQRNVIEGMLEELEKMREAQEKAEAAIQRGRELARQVNGNGKKEG